MKQFISLIASLAALTGLQTASHAEQPQKPFVRLAILIDASGSYADRKGEAVKKAELLIADMERRKAKRWEKADEIGIVSLDSVPEMIWQGTTKDMRTVGQTDWQSRFTARSDYMNCTDVTRGFRVALDYLNESPLPTEKYLVVFSDLLDEPPAGSPTVCKGAHALPGLSFPWEQLGDVSTTVFWMPKEQKFAWHNAVEEHKLGATFKLYTSSESDSVKLQPPPKAIHKYSEEEKAAAHMKVGGIASLLTTIIVGGIVFLFIAAALVGGAVFFLMRRKGKGSKTVVKRKATPAGTAGPFAQASAPRH